MHQTRETLEIDDRSETDAEIKRLAKLAILESNTSANVRVPP